MSLPLPQKTAQPTKPGIFLATPMYGGLTYHTYVHSLLDTYDWVGREQVPLALYLLANESLITRARNRCAAEFLASGMQKLLFVDADVSWTSKDIWRLYYSDKTLICGTYPVKRLPLLFNFNCTKEHHEKYFPDGQKTPEAFARFASEAASATGEVEISQGATGFMMIDRQVFIDMRKNPAVEYYEQYDFGLNRLEKHFDYFGCGPHRGNYESEDWRFSRLAGEAGHKTWMNVNVILPHTGTFSFTPGRQ
jgi:hypothetical protein